MAGPHTQMKVPHSELQHDTALQINFLSPLRSASIWVILQCSCSHGQPPSRAVHPNTAFAQRQSHAGISRTSTGCEGRLVKTDNTHVQRRGWHGTMPQPLPTWLKKPIYPLLLAMQRREGPTLEKNLSFFSSPVTDYLCAASTSTAGSRAHPRPYVLPNCPISCRYSLQGLSLGIHSWDTDRMGLKSRVVILLVTMAPPGTSCLSTCSLTG